MVAEAFPAQRNPLGGARSRSKVEAENLEDWLQKPRGVDPTQPQLGRGQGGPVGGDTRWGALA